MAGKILMRLIFQLDDKVCRSINFSNLQILPSKICHPELVEGQNFRNFAPEMKRFCSI